MGPAYKDGARSGDGEAASRQDRTKTYFRAKINVCNADAGPRGDQKGNNQTDDVPCFQPNSEVRSYEKKCEGGAKEEEALSKGVKRELESSWADFGNEKLADVGIDSEDGVGPDCIRDEESRHVFAD